MMNARMPLPAARSSKETKPFDPWARRGFGLGGVAALSVGAAGWTEVPSEPEFETFAGTE
jgi:hypothetical protein